MLQRIWLHARARFNERRADKALLSAALAFKLYVDCKCREDKFVRRLEALRRLREARQQ